LFLPFAANRLSIQIASLRVEHLTPELLLSLLEHLESDRNNVVRTCNHRLAAIKSLAKMIRLMYPEKRDEAQRILDLPLSLDLSIFGPERILEERPLSETGLV
jgi:hypothetical protein